MPTRKSGAAHELLVLVTLALLARRAPTVRAILRRLTDPTRLDAAQREAAYRTTAALARERARPENAGKTDDAIATGILAALPIRRRRVRR